MFAALASSRSPRSRGLLVVLALVLSPCLPGAARADSTHAIWQLLAGPVDPPPMYGQAAIHDPVRHRLLMIDGLHQDELWCLTLPSAGSPVWSRLQIRGPDFPGARHDFSAVYDSVADRVVVFGGWQTYGTDYDDVWALSLDADPHWTRILPQGEAPHSRAGHATAFDPVRRRMLVFGGYAYQGGQLDDAWELDLSGTPTWRRFETTGRAPSHREGARAIYDPWGDRVLLFGGWVDGEVGPPTTYRISDETWMLPLSGPAVWDSLELAQRPPARQTYAAILDREHRRWVISGGEGWQTGSERGDTWSLSLEGPLAWAQLITKGTGPGPISSHGAAYSPERGSMIQYGGIWTAAKDHAYELRLDDGMWSQLEPEGPVPAPGRRSGALLLPGSDSGHPLLWGGYSWHDLWRFDSNDGPAWTRLPTSGVPPIEGAQNFVVDSRRRRLIGIGGGDVLAYGGKLDQLWTLSLDAPRVWRRLEVSGDPPVGRSSFGAIYDSLRDRVLLYGGRNWASGSSRQADDLGELWELSLAEPCWRLLQANGTPGKRGGPQALYDPKRDRLLVLGGFTSGYGFTSPLYDNWALDLGADNSTWSRLGPSIPGDAQIVLDPLRDRLVAWSGGAGAWTLSLVRPGGWLALGVTGRYPTRRTSAGILYQPDQDRLLVFGGQVGGGFPSGPVAGDFYALRFGTPVAVDIRPSGAEGLVPLNSHGLVQAAILASESFSPDSVIVASVSLGSAHVVETPGGRWHSGMREVNLDGRVDLVLQFPIDSLQVPPGDSVVVLTGDTPNFAILGSASLRVPGSGSGGRTAVAADAELGAPEPRRLALLVENPSVTGLAVRFTLGGAAPARLEVFDITGRRVATRDLSAPVAGEQALSFEPGTLNPGVFLLRLTQGARTVHARAVLLR